MSQIKSKLISAAFVVASMLCLLTIALLPNKAVYFTEAAGVSIVGPIVITTSLILPILFLRFFKMSRLSKKRHVLLSPVFFVSIFPTIIIIWLFINSCFIRFPGYIFPEDSKKISIGMTRDQVIQSIGQFDMATSDQNGNWETFRYYVQRPWGFDDRKFHVRFINGKVVSAEFRTGIQADILTP